MARTNGVEELLPYTIKGTEERIRRRQEHGLRVKGTGVGQKVKGKLWERTMKGKLEKRKQAMLGMPKLIQQWKQVRLPSRLLKSWDREVDDVYRWVMDVVGRSGLSDFSGCVTTYYPNPIYRCVYSNSTEQHRVIATFTD